MIDMITPGSDDFFCAVLYNFIIFSFRDTTPISVVGSLIWLTLFLFSIVELRHNFWCQSFLSRDGLSHSYIVVLGSSYSLID